MKKFLAVCLLCVPFFSVSGKVADTISYWHIQYNNQVILELNALDQGYVLRIKADTVREKDVIGIRYSLGCLVCWECKNYLAVFTKGKNLLQYNATRGDQTPLNINFRQILREYKSKGETIFDFYYMEEGKVEPGRGVHVLRVKLE